jgi:hypothetical protein
MTASTRSLSLVLASVFFLFLLSACQSSDQAPALDEGADSDPTSATSETYGESVDAHQAIPVRTAVRSAQEYDGADVTVQGRIAQVCAKKGCWLAMDAGTARPVRVLVPRTDEGYGFTVPTDASGEAVVHGTLSVKALDTATRDHYESDSAARPDSVEVQIAARGITISPKS